jgi:hypothetical protein
MSVTGLVIATQMTAKWQMWLSLALLLRTAAGITTFVLAATVANRWFVERRGLAIGVLTAAFAAGQLIFLPTAQPEGAPRRWTDVCGQLNSLLRGWSAYFFYGTRGRPYKAVDHHVCGRVRHFLSRRHKILSRGTKRFPSDLVFGGLGVLALDYRTWALQ